MKQTEIDDAIRRIALTQDGHALHLFLQQALMQVSPSAESGALQSHEGERRFAAKLKGLMDEAYANAEQGSDGRKPGQSLVVIQRSAVAYAGSRGIARRVQSYPDSDAGTAGSA